MPLQRQTVEVGLSIAATIFGGFVLNIIGRLDPLGWALWLSAVVLLSSYIATIRGATTSVNVVAPLSITPRRPATRTVITASALAAALAITVATFVWKINADNNYRPFRFTEFWMVPLHSNDQGAFTIGVANQEPQTLNFDIEVRIDGATLAVWRTVTVKPGESVTKVITVPEGGAHERRVTAWLFKSDDPSFVYRQTSAVLPPQVVDPAPR
jgi:uncharacterized membrane protein